MLYEVITYLLKSTGHWRNKYKRAPEHQQKKLGTPKKTKKHWTWEHLRKQNRITSYNVCYTKLLRFKNHSNCTLYSLKPFHPAGMSGNLHCSTSSWSSSFAVLVAVFVVVICPPRKIMWRNRFVFDVAKADGPERLESEWWNQHVITSYSIHYTKLYDFVFHPTVRIATLSGCLPSTFAKLAG